MSTYITSVRSWVGTILTSCCILFAWLPASVGHAQIDTTIDFTTTFHGDRLLFLSK
jgi:hypothetical protein